MDSPYHRQILQQALGQRVSARALAAITTANLAQDDLAGLFFHPEYHFDGGPVAPGLKLIEEEREIAVHAASAPHAWAAFGRLSHAAQDFYAHSNYVALWLENHFPPPALRPPAPNLDALDPAFLKHPRLITWHIAWLWEIPAYIPSLRPWVRRHAPQHSHARENLDTPESSSLFPYAMEAAIQRTRAEFDRTLALMGEETGETAVQAFLDKGSISL